jgi:sec-independent protein translocase protein TatA
MDNKSSNDAQWSLEMPSLGGWEWVIILVIVLLLFGVGRLSKLGEEMGKGVRSFREGIRESGEDEPTEETTENQED